MHGETKSHLVGFQTLTQLLHIPLAEHGPARLGEGLAALVLLHVFLNLLDEGCGARQHRVDMLEKGFGDRGFGAGRRHTLANEDDDDADGFQFVRDGVEVFGGIAGVAGEGRQGRRDLGDDAGEPERRADDG